MSTLLTSFSRRLSPFFTHLKCFFRRWVPFVRNISKEWMGAAEQTFYPQAGFRVVISCVISQVLPFNTFGFLSRRSRGTAQVSVYQRAKIFVRFLLRSNLHSRSVDFTHRSVLANLLRHLFPRALSSDSRPTSYSLPTFYEHAPATHPDVAFLRARVFVRFPY